MRNLFGVTLPIWLLANFGVSAYMTGVIWLVQLVQYPSFEKVGPAQFIDFERHHTTRISWVVGAPMLFEVVAAVALAYLAYGTFLWTDSVIALLLVVIIWLSTFAVQVPCHSRLEKEFHRETCQRLVRTNWIRTVAWSVRSVLLASMLAGLFRLLTQGVR